MNRDHMVVLVLGIVALVATWCVHQSSHQVSQASASASAQKHLPEVIEFPRQTLIFKPTRDDFTVGSVIFNFYCSNAEEVRVNGVKLDPTWRDIHLTLAGIVVDRRTSNVFEGGAAWTQIFLTQVSSNHFELPHLKIESSGEHSGYLCMSIKAWFNEVGNDGDSPYYQHVDDRYALVSYSTYPSSDLPAQVRHRFSQNRVGTVGEFKEALSKTFVIRLNQLPLGEKRSR
jgi:hypothetical protein